MSSAPINTELPSSTSPRVPSHSAILWHKIELAKPRLQNASVRFWSDEALKFRFPGFLATLYQIVDGGLGVMREAAAQCRLLASRDEVAATAASYFERHLGEEQDHAQWLLDDMQESGFDAKEALKIAPGSIASLIGAQAYWVKKQHPVAFFGYIAVVEGDPPTQQHLDSIRQSTGIPAQAFRCLREHAELDVNHVAELRETLDRLPLTPAQHQLIAMSAFEAIEGLARIFDELSNSSVGALR